MARRSPCPGPTASATSSTCNVSVKVSLTPVALSVAGTLGRPNNLKEALIGQGQVGTVSADGYQLKYYQWSSPTGVVFKSATWGSASHHYNPLEASDLVQESLGFFASYPTNETVQVSVDVRLPSTDPNADGPLLGRVSLSQDVQVVAPEIQYQAYHFGQSQLKSSNVNPGSFQSGDHQTTSALDCGAAFSYRVNSLPEFTLSQGFSSAGLSQLVNALYKEIYNAYCSSETGAGGEWVLDNQLHYDGWNAADNTLYAGGGQTDTPGMGLSTGGSIRVIHAQSDSGFKMFLIYQPPDGGCRSTIVPLAFEGWNWNSSASEGSTAGVWNNPVGNPAGEKEGVYPLSLYQWDYSVTNNG